MDHQNGETVLNYENGKFPEDRDVAGEIFSAQHNVKVIEMSPNSEEGNALMDGEQTCASIATFFAPHPPELPNDNPSHQSPRRTKRFERRVHPKADSSSDKLPGHGKAMHDKRTNGSKLAPLKGKESDVVPFNNGEKTSLDNNSNHKPLPLKLKPLAPIKDQQKLVEDFKSAQFMEGGQQTGKDKWPLKPLKPNYDSSKMALRSEIGEHTGTVESCNIEMKNLEDGSDSSLTSVSSESSDYADSDDESAVTQGDNISSTPKFYPNVPPLNNTHHNSLSLTSVRDLGESVGRHSDSEAMRRERREKRQSRKALWNKSKVMTLLPRVPASKARDRNSNFVQEELEKYLPEQKLMIFIGTWNMHGEKQLPVFVDDYLLPECCQFMQDLYVVGTQESTPLRKEWEIKLQEALGPSHVLIYSCAFGVLHLAMYLRRELVWFCSAVEQATVATRPGHMIKTKGAVGLTLSIFGTSFLFINSHFTAHEHKWKERIADYRIIRKTLSLPLNYAESQTRTTDVTSRFHQVFWFGDFNFRVEERQGVVEKFLRQCEDDDEASYEELLGKDQMRKLMNKEDGVFEHFKECAINFPPTYRFNINPGNPGHYSSVRVPSWTDRIVYRSRDENDVKPLYYDCCTSLNISDHRPVFGIFEATIKPIKDSVVFTGVHFVRDVYIEANRRRAAPPRNQRQTSVCTIL